MKKREDSPQFKLIVTSKTSSEPEARLERAYRSMATRFERLTEKELLTVNIDVPGAVATILGAAPDVVRLRPHLATLGSFDVSKVDTLEDAALAVAYARTQCSQAPPQVDLGGIARPLHKVRRAARLGRLTLVPPSVQTAGSGLRGRAPGGPLPQKKRG